MTSDQIELSLWDRIRLSFRAGRKTAKAMWVITGLYNGRFAPGDNIKVSYTVRFEKFGKGDFQLGHVASRQDSPRTIEEVYVI